MSNLMPTRRSLMLGAAVSGALAPAMLRAQLLPGDEVVPLWPKAIPGDRHSAIVRKVAEQLQDPQHPDRWVSGIAQPVLVVRRPARPNGATVLVMPGGGYAFLSYDNEGTSQAKWLNDRGITAFILLYRLPGEGWAERQVVPLQDAQRALRLIRAGSTRFGIAADKIAVLGFSAGGHLAGSLATRFAEPTYAPVDRIDTLSARPDLVGLLYPVVSLEAPFTHGGSRDKLLGPDASAALRHAGSVETRVTADTPPTFLVHAADDGLVPVANSLALFGALTALKRPSELHVFDAGGHGFGVRLPRTMPAAAWPQLFHAFGASKGVFPA